jgi:hypothetical protein
LSEKEGENRPRARLVSGRRKEKKRRREKKKGKEERAAVTRPVQSVKTSRPSRRWAK